MTKKIRNHLKLQSGMTLVQVIVLIVIAAVVIILAGPRFLENRRLSQAVSDVEMIADACEDYFKDTGEYCTKLDNLTGKYLEKIPKNPWGGNYVIDPERGKIGIPENDQKVPQKYRLGGIAEISKIYKEGASLW